MVVGEEVTVAPVSTERLPEGVHEATWDEIVDRFTVLGTVDECTQKLRELEALGVTEYNIYTTVPEPERLIETYGREVIPTFGEVAA